LVRKLKLNPLPCLWFLHPHCARCLGNYNFSCAGPAARNADCWQVVAHSGDTNYPSPGDCNSHAAILLHFPGLVTNRKALLRTLWLESG